MLKYVSINHEKFTRPTLAFGSVLTQFCATVLIEVVLIYKLVCLTDVAGIIMNFLALSVLAGFDDMFLLPFIQTRYRLFAGMTIPFRDYKKSQYIIKDRIIMPKVVFDKKNEEYPNTLSVSAESASDYVNEYFKTAKQLSPALNISINVGNKSVHVAPMDVEMRLEEEGEKPAEETSRAALKNDETMEPSDARQYKSVSDIHDVGSVKQSFDLVGHAEIKDLQDYVLATWNMKADEDKQRELYTQLGLYVVRAGENKVWDSKTTMGKLTSKGWWMLQLYNFIRFLYVVFYKNVLPFIVLILASYYIVFE